MTERNTPRIPDPQGTLAGMPYDWRRPTAQRLRDRMWNPDDPRVFTPKAFGMGWDINLYRLLRPRGGKAGAQR
ncbi:MAG TPA: DUF5808 domain-containing protein [Nocardia sp.]|uniref:DUF5808 domain-containing protein n=1 Tax=Nocardia TaxID=1817 RepID=UPI002456FCF1|nr:MULTISPECIES: DUF5808 domain-containing protein [Nocardia]HLS79117.1 DUF5808 domain-containing protein [Nocardia sp.]